MKTVIVGRTHMGVASACAGALSLDDGRGLRLFNVAGEYPIRDHYRVGQAWDMDVEPKEQVRPPHVEDVVVHRERYIGDIADLRGLVLGLVTPWQGELDHVFENTLTVANSKLYVGPGGSLPSQSTHFWLADRELRFDADETRYEAVLGQRRTIKYVGLDEPTPTIVPGELVRLSLASWYQGRYLPEERCYLQVSGSLG
ncbi:MAG: hypothetical protein P1T08_09295 [Acidimicrobiia bacterium]|nr:hypothetical protein [Acidimicrobiia bacterium]